MPTLAGIKQIFHPSFPSLDAPFPSFDRKWTVLIRQRWTSKCLFPRRRFLFTVLKKIFPKLEKEKVFP